MLQFLLLVGVSCLLLAPTLAYPVEESSSTPHRAFTFPKIASPISHIDSCISFPLHMKESYETTTTEIITAPIPTTTSIIYLTVTLPASTSTIEVYVTTGTTTVTATSPTLSAKEDSQMMARSTEGGLSASNRTSQCEPYIVVSRPH